MVCSDLMLPTLYWLRPVGKVSAPSVSKQIAMGRKFHHNYKVKRPTKDTGARADAAQTNRQASRARHRLRPRLTAKVQTRSCMFGHVPSRRISASPCSHARQGERWPLASSTQGCCHPDRPASDDRCVCPLWRTQLGARSSVAGR